MESTPRGGAGARGLALSEPEPEPADQPDADTALWRRAAAGDQAAFGELFERHLRAVWNHCYRLSGSHAQAEDLTASTFLTAWRRRAEVTLVRDSALPWLFAVAGNLVRSEERRALRFLRAVRRTPEPGTAPDHADAVVDRLTSGQRLRDVLAAIAELPKGERQVVQLCLLGELSTADAAEVLGIAQVSVRTQLSRARARLRASFGEERS